MTFKLLTFWSSNWKAWIYVYLLIYGGIPGGSDDKESACNAGDVGLISESYLENPKDRGAWWATIHGAKNAQAYFQVGYEDEKNYIDWLYWLGVV